jgi:predicted Zn-dependent protease
MSRTKNNKPGQKARERRQKMTDQREQLYELALQQVEQSQPADALKTAKQLWTNVQNRPKAEQLPALNLLGEISIELGAVDSARSWFEKAVQLDPNGDIAAAQMSGAEKFLWLAQLSEEGGQESVSWYERGVNALQNEIAAIENGQVTGFDAEQLLQLRAEKKRKLANTLCAVIEVYMTDLSWEDDAEARCESLITQAVAVEDETSAEVLQVLASIRLSQTRKEDAQAALRRSLQVWQDLEPEDPAVPDFATKISLSRLLMEAELNTDAWKVLNRLIQEDDQSVEAWYLGGWCQYLVAEDYENGIGIKSAAGTDAPTLTVEEQSQRLAQAAFKGSRRWLQSAQKLFKIQDYEDDRLLAHVQELLVKLDEKLGPAEGKGNGDGEEESEDDWEGITDEEGDDDDQLEDDDDGDARMAES